MTDQDIVLQFLSRQQEALKLAYDRYKGYIGAIAMNVLGDSEDAAEITNDTLLAAWNSIPPNKPENLRAYLGKLARRISIDRYREKRAAKRAGDTMSVCIDEIKDCIPSDTDIEKEIEANELADCLNDFLKTLKVADRNIFVSRYFFLLKVHEISKKYGIPLSTVKSSLFRTRNKLKKYLEERGIKGC